MPLTDDRIAALVNFQVFLIINLKNGFFHMPVETENQNYTAFVIRQMANMSS